MVNPKKIPWRVCIGCREKRPKKELMRIVRAPEGIIAADLTGKKSGRGAYICKQTECLEKAIKGKRFEKNFQVALSPEIFEEIKRLLEQ